MMGGFGAQRLMGRPTARERGRALLATGLVYLLLLIAFLLWHDRPPQVSPPPRSPRLRVFFLPPPIRPVPVVSKAARPRVRSRPSGVPKTPGQHRLVKLAQPVTAPSPSRERPVLLSPLLNEPVLVTTQEAGTILGQPGGAGGPGQGNGGSGGGDGDGNGSGGVARYGRAAWIHTPTKQEMLPFWPVRAIQQKIGGHVVLACDLRKAGHPRDCVVRAETPAGYGFGAAAVDMSRIFLIRPVTRNGKSLDLPILVPIDFVRTGAAAP